jgi:hypothetical protein
MRVYKFLQVQTLPHLLSDSQCLLGSKFSGILIQLSLGKVSTFKKVLVVMMIKCTHFLRHLALARLVEVADMVEELQTFTNLFSCGEVRHYMLGRPQ